MTRLTDALKKAQAASPDTPTAVPAEAQSSVDAAPKTWTFDAPLNANPAQFPAPAAEVHPPVFEQRPAENDGEPEDTYPFARFGKLVVGPSPDATLVEQYRHLAAALHHAQARTGARSVMVASAVEAEGKTTTAANVALTLSHSYRRRVLLIDADLRRPSTHAVFQLDNHVGLSDVLKSRTEGARLPVQQVSSRLWVLVAGRPDHDPMSGLVSDTMKQVLDDAMDEFDWVVVDTPPVALLTDANLLAAMIDQALLVVSASTTPYPLVKRAVDAIGSERILGVVLNRAKRSDMAIGYGSYKYTYGRPSRNKKRRLFGFARKTAL